MIDFNRHIEIEEFLAGRMTAEEAAAFGDKINSDPKLKAEVELQKMANSVVVGSAKKDIRNKLNTIHQEDQKRKSFRKYGFIFLSIIGLCVVGIGLNQESKPKTNQNLDDETSVNLMNQPKYSDSVKVEIVTSDSLIDQPEPVKENKIKTASIRVEYKADIVEIEKKKLNLLPKVPKVEVDKRSGVNEEPDTLKKQVNPCLNINNVQPKFEIKKPCFGGEGGSIILIDPQFIEYAIEGSESFLSKLEEFPVNKGVYRFIARDNNNCVSESAQLSIDYGECNYTILRNQFKYLKFDFNALNSPIMFEVRNARTAEIVYQERIEFEGDFIYKGVDQSNNQLPMGNYVYAFKNENGSYFVKGQVTVIE